VLFFGIIFAIQLIGAIKMGESEKQIIPESTELENQPNSENKKKGGGEPSLAESQLDAIADDLTNSMPEVQQHAIEQESLNEKEKLAQYSHLTDVDGNSFDPSIHKTNKAGEPTTSTKGKLIKKAGRKASPQKTSSFVGGQGAQQSQREVQNGQARASGIMTANLLLQVGIVMGGEEWYPQTDEASGLNEKSMLENAFADYFQATGKTDIPPNIALIVAVGAYVLPRFTMPKTKTRVQSLFGGIKKWFINRKLRKHGLKAESNEKPRSTISIIAGLIKWLTL
jgi:hypothetical protein